LASARAPAAKNEALEYLGSVLQIDLDASVDKAAIGREDLNAEESYRALSPAVRILIAGILFPSKPKAHLFSSLLLFSFSSFLLLLLSRSCVENFSSLISDILFFFFIFRAHLSLFLSD
jgi:hypothetical protein